MRESYGKGLANRPGPESYAGSGDIAGVATAGVRAGWVFQLRNQIFRRADLVLTGGRQYEERR